MTAKRETTRTRLLEAAATLVAEESLSQLSIDRISDRAGVSRRSFFSHFPSKDDLLAAVVQHARPAYLDRYRMWADSCGPNATMAERVDRIFAGITAAARNPHWQGSCFIRMTAELGSMRGHPVHAIVRAANSDMEHWFETEFRAEGYSDAAAIAKRLVVLINGLLMVQLITRDSSYGEDVSRLVKEMLAPPGNRNREGQEPLISRHAV